MSRIGGVAQRQSRGLISFAASLAASDSSTFPRRSHFTHRTQAHRAASFRTRSGMTLGMLRARFSPLSSIVLERQTRPITSVAGEVEQRTEDLLGRRGLVLDDDLGDDGASLNGLVVRTGFNGDRRHAMLGLKGRCGSRRPAWPV